jgi:hypothetical protein
MSARRRPSSRYRPSRERPEVCLARRRDRGPPAADRSASPAISRCPAPPTPRCPSQQNNVTGSAFPAVPSRTYEPPNQCWVGDMTFIDTRAGWFHLAELIDLCSRSMVNWPCPIATTSRWSPPPCAWRSRIGSLLQVRSITPVATCCTTRATNAVWPHIVLLSSMSRHGYCYDNATMRACRDSSRLLKN